MSKRQPQASEAVSAILRKSLSDAADAALERDIAWFGQLMQQSMARYERTGCFGDRGDADRWERMRDEAIAKRSCK